MPDRFYFYHDKGRVIKIDLYDLLYVETSGNYVNFVGRTYKDTARVTLEKALDMFPEDAFIRVCRTHALSVENVAAFNRECAWFHGDENPISYTPIKKFYDAALRKLKIFDREFAEGEPEDVAEQAE